MSAHSHIECVRCQRPLRSGTPDPKSRGIQQSATTGFCAACMIAKFLLGIEPIRELIEGIPARGGRPPRPGHGPEVLFGGPYLETIRPVIAGVLAHTQLREDQIDWIEVVGNWGLPWPRGCAPKAGDV